MKRMLVITSVLFGINGFVHADRVTLPSAEELHERLCNAGFGLLVEKTNIIDQLASKELKPLTVVVNVEGALEEYEPHIPWEQVPSIVGITSIESIMKIHKYELLNIILKDHPQELAKLNEHLNN